MKTVISLAMIALVACAGCGATRDVAMPPPCPMCSWNGLLGLPGPAPTLREEDLGSSSTPFGYSITLARATRAEDLEKSVLVLPQLWTPTRSQPLPPSPAPLTKPELPASFTGCWVGDPGGFDRVYELSNIGFQLGEPGRMQFCYYADQITIPQADVRVPLAGRVLDLLLDLGLSFHTFSAHSTSTEVYRLTGGEIRARTWLEVEHTGHFLFVFPYHASTQSSVVDWDAKLAAPDICVLNALQVVNLGPTPLFAATWHGTFRRSSTGDGN